MTKAVAAATAFVVTSLRRRSQFPCHRVLVGPVGFPRPPVTGEGDLTGVVGRPAGQLPFGLHAFHLVAGLGTRAGLRLLLTEALVQVAVLRVVVVDGRGPALRRVHALLGGIAATRV